MIKKLALSLLVILGFSYYVSSLRQQNSDTDPDDAIVADIIEQPSPTPVLEAIPTPAVEVPSPLPSPLPSPSPSPTPVVAMGKFKNGTYTGDPIEFFYGTMQVKATVSGGKLTNVQFLQYPTDRQNSIEVNQYAMPILRQEAIQSQSAEVDTVSGATESSRAFRETLQSALGKAS